MTMSPTLLPVQQQQQSMTPQMPYPQQQAASLNNGTSSGGVASMIKALMDGQNQFRQRQALAQQMQQRNTQPAATGLPGVSVPMTPNAIPGSPGSTSNLPGMPNGIDPTVQGLFSPIPGQGG